MTAPPPGFRSRVDGRRIRSLLSMRRFIGEVQNPRTVWALGGSRLTGRSRGRRFKSGQPDGENPCTGGCRMDGRRAGVLSVSGWGRVDPGSGVRLLRVVAGGF